MLQSRTQSNASARTRKALALGKYNFSCAVIGLTFISSACRQRTGAPKFSGSGCLLPFPKLMRGLGMNVKKCPNYEMNQITKKTTSKLVSIQSLKTFT
jgi:hypothetical protein